MASSMINFENITSSFTDFKKADPYPHCVIDNFLLPEFAELVAKEFPEYNSDAYNGNYDNAIELKKTCNVWDRFPANTYRLISFLNSTYFVDLISKLTEDVLFSDPGLHGGGWHIHPNKGKLNPHLDYNIHPKLGLQRKYNLLLYLTPGWKESWGGDFGLWNSDNNKPTSLNKTIAPLFNRAIFFDTTMNSWHGLATEVQSKFTRNSIAVYYLTAPGNNDSRMRALFAPTQEQQGNQEILDLIKRRSQIKSTDVDDWDRK